MSSFSWIPFTVERLLILRAQGLMHSSIAVELGTTPSAIEHKLRRLRSQKPAQATAVTAVRRPVKLFDLRPVTAAGLSLGAAKGALFGGKPKVGTSPYCFEHTQQAWQRPQIAAPTIPA